MAELKITPVVPVDDDDEPVRKKRAPAAPRKPRDPSARTAPRVEGEEVVDPSEPEFDPKAVSDEVKKRYGIDGPLKVSEVKRSRSGVKSHKTGATRR